MFLSLDEFIVSCEIGLMVFFLEGVSPVPSLLVAAELFCSWWAVCAYPL